MEAFRDERYGPLVMAMLWAVILGTVIGGLIVTLMNRTIDTLAASIQRRTDAYLERKRIEKEQENWRRYGREMRGNRKGEDDAG